MLIKAKTKFQKHKEMKPQLYRGHTTIELKSVRTGSRERIESDNTFTLGIDNHLLASGYANNSPFANSVWRSAAIYHKLIGGILLFDTEIEAVNGVLPTTMPGGVKMVANGSYGVSNNSNVTEMGTSNANESSFTASALNYVYDWSSDQGNGNIKCVSLTSDVGGYIGYGNSVSQASLSTKKNLFENQSTSDLAGSVAALVIGNDLYYTAFEATTSFTLHKIQSKIGKISLFDFESIESVAIPSEINSTNKYVYATDGGKFIVIPRDNIASNFKVGLFDPVQKTWETYTIPSGFSISGGNFQRVRPVPGGVYDNEQEHMVFFDDLTNVINIGLGGYVVPINDDLFIGTNGRIFDKSSGETYLTNASISLANNPYCATLLSKNRIMINSSVGRNSLYLATVNNLDEPVTKTASQTMKVTYTVTPAA